jgi:hypothetical protein
MLIGSASFICKVDWVLVKDGDVGLLLHYHSVLLCFGQQEAQLVSSTALDG